ncbi:DUF3592 domain-containing protein [Parahaliea aestuarii]|uniref:DUF3592 domain-containing protein n=1 Tax=Parahaliea aestuarii TaxID=1852021 RepID=A0A5C8ZW36_9GAMM|nr:DUF3592 domain-containing protein [Parahaliea aestuarii]TXS91677.1 DUF3592 domain-containing protein [Parahaliea aestuarii]
MKTGNTVFTIFAVIGLLAVAGAVWMFLNTREFIANAASAEGTVIELVRSRSSDSTTYRPVVTFTSADGREIEFTSTSGSNPPAFHRGERVTVLYRPEAPETARIGSFFSLWGLELIFGGIGSLFVLIGGGALAFQVYRKRLHQHLRRHGTPVKAELQSVTLDSSYEVNGRNPYRIHAQWQDPHSRQVYVFSSEPIWYDPSEFVTSEVIAVYIERGDPSRYYMDTSFLPPAGDT